MKNTTNPARSLGAFIRAHRERMPTPEKAGTRRRTPGWRREELADASGLGVTWITWLEQGRAVQASAAALSRLAEALQLSPAERASLFDLAGRRDPRGPQLPGNEVDAELLGLPAQFVGPAYLLDAGWTARAWNAAAAELFVGWLDADAEERNLLAYVLESPIARMLIVDWSERARRLIAEFHADFNRHPTHAGMQALVERLSSVSELFRQHWRQQDVLGRDGGERGFTHPALGPRRYLQTTLLVARQPDLKLVCLAPLSGEPGEV